MKLGQAVDWDSEVLPTWRRAAVNSRHANADIWSRLPLGVCWLAAEIEAVDVAQMRVVGSQDWRDVFGSYRLCAIAARYQADLARWDRHAEYHDPAAPGTPHGLQAMQAELPPRSLHKISPHHSRITRLLHSFAQEQRPLLPLILVAADVRGPLVLLDGNHRALALLQIGRLVGQRCYLGLHWQMASEFLWMQRALTGD